MSQTPLPRVSLLNSPFKKRFCVLNGESSQINDLDIVGTLGNAR